MDIKGKVAVVTGGCGGIGVSIVKKLLEKGAKFVAIFDFENPTSRSTFNDLQKEYGNRVGCYPTDVTNKAQFIANFDKVIDSHKVIDILINNAGIPRENNPELMIDVNYKAVVSGTLLMIERLGKHKGGPGGTVVNTASIVGLVNCGLPIYCSTKHAVVSFVRNMDRQVKNTGVRVMAVCPGVTSTQFLQDIGVQSNGLDFNADTYVGVGDLWPSQSSDNVGVAVVHIIEHGKSGECWVSEEDQPPYLTREEVKDHKDLRV